MRISQKIQAHICTGKAFSENFQFAQSFPLCPIHDIAKKWYLFKLLSECNSSSLVQEASMEIYVIGCSLTPRIQKYFIHIIRPMDIQQGSLWIFKIEQCTRVVMI